MVQGVPVVSAPSLQECVNSHILGISKSLNVHPDKALRRILQIQRNGGHVTKERVKNGKDKNDFGHAESKKKPDARRG
jgi:hypothetical protein